MRVLLVEDEEAFADLLIEAFSELAVEIEIVVAKSRESALSAMELEDIDVIICDLRIPPNDASLAADVDHGMYVFQFARERLPGVPIRFLSAFATLNLIARALSDAPVMDTFGTGENFSMAGYFEKDDYRPCIEWIRECAAELEALRSIEVSGGRRLSELQKRVLRVFARRHGGTIVQARSLDSGLSEAVVLGIDVIDQTGGKRATVVAKLASLSVIEDERRRYNQFVSPQLESGSFAHYADSVTSGACRLGGIFYKLAADYPQNLFEVLAADPPSGALVVEKLGAQQRPWRDARHAANSSVADIRRRIISDDEMEAYSPLIHARWNEFEGKTIQVSEQFQHGDLHGANLLVSQGNVPLMIDYGDVDSSVASLDPVTLELSLLFHPGAELLRRDWPSLEIAQSWLSLDDYLVGCPVPDFVRACRAWSLADSASEQAVLANVYTYALRQLRYSGTDHALAKAIVAGAIAAALAA